MPRIDPDLVADERTSLRQWLDYHRATLVMKASGVSEEQARLTLTPGGLSLLGLVRHMSDVERHWFPHTFAADPAAARPYYWGEAPDGDPDGDWHPGPDATMADALRVFEAACARSREVEAVAPSLDALSRVEEAGRGRFDLRWIMVHMIEETARHNGHADLLREAADGTTGD